MTTAEAPKPQVSSTVYSVLFSVATCHGINDTMQAVLLSVYPLLAQSYSLSFAQVGMITLVFQVTASILQPVFGTITDPTSAMVLRAVEKEFRSSSSAG